MIPFISGPPFLAAGAGGADATWRSASHPLSFSPEDQWVRESSGVKEREEEGDKTTDSDDVNTTSGRGRRGREEIDLLEEHAHTQAQPKEEAWICE